MITIKSKREIELMKEAGAIVAYVLKEIEKYIKPGVSTLELDAIAENMIRSKGAVPSFKGYEGFPASICTSINNMLVHGIPSAKAILHEGDIISIDCGAMYNFNIETCRYTRHVLDSVAVIVHEITNDDVESVRLFYTVQTPEPDEE